MTFLQEIESNLILKRGKVLKEKGKKKEEEEKK